MRPYQLFATLVLSTFACLNHAQSDLDIIVDDGPSWTAGGHYTAELDLGAKTLTLLPLVGADQVINLATLNVPSDLSPGVYMLDSSNTGFRLISTHPDGVIADAYESRPIVASNHATESDLSLSTQALSILSDANVGAIYIH